MAYFNHAFTKIFLGTGTSLAPVTPSVTNPASDKGLILTAGVTTETISKLSPGYFGIINPKPDISGVPQWTTLNPVTTVPTTCCPIMIASSSVIKTDKIGPFHGGYKETNKSKIINPKYVQQAYKITSCVPQQAVVSVGTTPQTIIPGLPSTGFQGGTVQANCPFQYLCGETYYLRIDIKGSPALRFLNHNAYQTVSAYTGCCPGTVPTAVDPTLVYLEWAKAIVINNYLKDLVAPVVYDYTGVAWYAPGTTQTYDGTGAVVTPAQWWTSATGVNNYAASPQAAAWNATLVNANDAGLRLFGAYVETKFLNCSFQITDFFEKEPVRIYASLVDYNGDPCVFEGVCVYNDCLGQQGMGFGEQVVRDLILSESYLQNFFHTDIRVREITHGNDILDAINRNALYTRYFLLHSVPRFNNPTGTFDSDRYLVEIVVAEANPLVPTGIPSLDTFLTNWLGTCVNCVNFIPNGCVRCTVVPDNAEVL